MKLYFLLDDLLDADNPDSVADKLVIAIETWLQEEGLELALLNTRPDELDGWQVGIQFECKRKAALKAPLDFLCQWAKKAEREFVIGIFDPKSGDREDVCYFGYEEGRPDINEVAMYLGLSR